MENFPKSLVFWKGESSALVILLKAGEREFLLMHDGEKLKLKM